MRFTLTTALDITECGRRLRERIFHVGPWQIQGPEEWSKSTPVIRGYVQRDSFTFWAHIPYHRGGGSGYVCTGTLKSIATGTQIKGRIGMTIGCWIAISIFLYFALTFVALILSTTISDYLAARTSVADLIRVCIIVGGLFIGATAFIFLLPRLTGPDDPKYLLKFLKDTLETNTHKN